MRYLPPTYNNFARAIPRFNQNRFMGINPVVQNMYRPPIYPQQYGYGNNGLFGNSYGYGNNGFFGNPFLTAALFGGGLYGGFPYGGYGGGVYNPCPTPPPDCGGMIGAVNGGFDPSFSMSMPATW